MTGFRLREGDQPLPQPSDGPSMHDLAIADLKAAGWPGSTAAAELLAARKRVGVDRYGQELRPNNGRDALRDLSEELADAAVYARQVLEEERLLRDDDGVIRVGYDALLSMLSQVCEIQAGM